MKRYFLPFLCLIPLLYAGCKKVPRKDYRGEMRQFVKEIATYARSQDPDFIVIPQNGQELITTDGAPGGPLASEYVSAVDGCGREDLFFGYTSDNTATPSADHTYMLEWVARWRDAGKTVMVTDYVSDTQKMEYSYEQNALQGFISFAADERNLNDIPSQPVQPYNHHNGNVSQLSDARNFLYLINPEKFAGKSAFLQALQQTNYDLIIMDAFFNDETYTPQEIASLKTKGNGGKRLVISYMSIGEAEDYRYYWKSAWKKEQPSFIYRKNPDWPGNYKVFYWEPEWKAIITGNSASYTQKILDAGFDGVYLDIIDAFEYYEKD
ncbi:MAG: endo alpha-1,4 polygalactosaminidase [Bacteroidia bacterium]|nr:endo alpha-1,4 polygalactosaminidase [Bacteroidia bacterium]